MKDDIKTLILDLFERIKGSLVNRISFKKVVTLFEFYSIIAIRRK